MKDKKKIKRRTYLDIGKREKVKDYKDKRTKDGERFQENIVEKKSKLNNFEREIKSTDKKGGLSLSQKQIEKHRAKEERTGDLNNLEKITVKALKKCPEIAGNFCPLHDVNRVQIRPWGSAPTPGVYRFCFPQRVM